mmetsp:Transcript_8838/g.15042  ORF Transcript_8838/g.15042 Transcript_8838/m.15042 type:complete len:261 (+) Transcript_8838:1333-2115(+)
MPLPGAARPSSTTSRMSSSMIMKPVITSSLACLAATNSSAVKLYERSVPWISGKAALLTALRPAEMARSVSSSRYFIRTIMRVNGVTASFFCNSRSVNGAGGGSVVSAACLSMEGRFFLLVVGDLEAVLRSVAGCAGGTINARYKAAVISTAVLEAKNISCRGRGLDTYAGRALVLSVSPNVPPRVPPAAVWVRSSVPLIARVPSSLLCASCLARPSADRREMSAGRSHFSGLEGFSSLTSSMRSSLTTTVSSPARCAPF